MSHKALARIAVAIVVVFLVTIVVYPLIFGTDPEPQKGPPVELELGR